MIQHINEQTTLEWTQDEAQKVIDYFRKNCVGKSNAKPREEVAKVMFPGQCQTQSQLERCERVLRAIITSLNQKGFPILSGSKGLYWSVSPDDIGAVKARFLSMANHLLAKVRMYEEIENKLGD
jgi:hypothetical protein